MEVAKTIENTKKLIKIAKNEQKSIGFVPTMGALHAGHISLITAARKKCDFVAVSIFVNPTQFAPTEDLNNYPRPLEKDLEICQNAGVDLVFLPSNEQMYPSPNLTWVTVETLSANLCGQSRPTHFRGVTTVCTKLFNIIEPDFAFFGQKDAQQSIIIKKMVADLNMPLEIVVCPTVRQPDGLAMSSRNKYLTAEQKQQATGIYKSLQFAEKLIQNGQTDPEKVIAQMRQTFAQYPLIESDYICIVDVETLQNINRIKAKVLIAVAAKLGKSRLIDNIMVDAEIL